MDNIKDKNQDQKSSIAVIILAAGASRRMGQPKQLLPYRRQTLLSYVIECAIARCPPNKAIASTCNPVIVVLGANADKIEPQIDRFPIKIVKNSQWNQGISSSISCGIAYVREQYSNIDAVVFLTCDQPFISPEIIEQLIEAHNSTNKPIIASRYENNIGIPALFYRSFFSEIIGLKGDLSEGMYDLAQGEALSDLSEGMYNRGAKRIINKYPDLVGTIDFPLGAIDLDTLEDYQRFITKIQS